MLTLASGAVAIVETTAPGGGPACTGPDDPDEGCAEVSGDLVLKSPNSTGDYVVHTSEPTAAAAFAPRDFEIRFTARGSVGYVGSGGSARLFRVPFELWDVGVVTPGAANDPADDRQLIANLTVVQTGGCRWDFGTSTGSDPTRTPNLRAYYPTGDDYAAYAALAEAAVAADPAGCPTGTAGAPAAARANVAAGAPVRSVYLTQTGTRSAADLAGSTVRFYTADRLVGAEAAPGAAAAVRLGLPYPNPARGSLTVSVPHRWRAACAWSTCSVGRFWSRRWRRARARCVWRRRVWRRACTRWFSTPGRRA